MGSCQKEAEFSSACARKRLTQMCKRDSQTCNRDAQTFVLIGEFGKQQQLLLGLFCGMTLPEWLQMF